MLCFSRRLAGLLGGLVLIAIGAGAAAPASAERVPLRQVDWEAVIRSEPRITMPPDCPPFFVDFGPCVEIATDDVSVAGASGLGPVGDTITGYADLLPEDIQYGDLDADGEEEALIRVESGGTAGTIGFLIFRAGDPAPELAVAPAGYKVWPRMVGGLLLVTEPYYFGFEGNCCPTGALQVAYALRGNRLIELAIDGVSPQWLLSGEDERSVTFAELTVHAFYRALSLGRYEDAYALLSPAFQAREPFERWRAGFASTVSITVETQAGGEGVGPADGRYVYEVLVWITAVDQAPYGERTTSCFNGRWFLVKGPEGGVGLLLDTADISIAGC
jgi:hypothetical protein